MEPRPVVDRFAVIADLAAYILAPTERAHVDGLDEPARAECVIRYWTWKEAALKLQVLASASSPAGWSSRRRAASEL